ncbi:hypothetical protein Tco_0931695 [Tanacetum coccineum]
MYSFGQDEEYVAVKGDEYEYLTSTSEDACRAYQEIFRMMDERWMDLAEKKSTKLVKYESSGILCVIVVMLAFRRMLIPVGFPPGFLLLQVSFAPLVLLFLSYLPSLRPVPMSSGSHFVGEPIVPKFDMHTFTSSMMVDEVSALAEEYAIPSDLRPRVSPLMLYEIGLTTIWKHVGHHPKFKEGEGNVAASIIPLPVRALIPANSDHQREVEGGDERILAAKEKKKAQDAQDKAAGKRPRRAGTFSRTKKRKTIPLSMALSEFEADEAFDASHNNNNNTKEVNSLHSAYSPHLEHSLHSEEHTEVRTSEEHLNKGDDNVQHAATYTEVFVSTSGGSGRRIFPGRHSGGGEGVNLRTHLSPPDPFRYEALNDDYEELYEAHSSCKGLSQRLTDTQNSLVEALRTRATLSEDHKALQQVHLECAGKEVALTKKMAVVEKEKDDLLDKTKDQAEQIKRLEMLLLPKQVLYLRPRKPPPQLKGDLEHLTVDLSQA